jgi:type IV secretory pathway TraG/TraD family ATPase VirD4
LNRILSLWLLIAFCLAWPAASHAQDRAQVTRQITIALTDIALIERERARSDVADDFAAQMLTSYRQQLEDGYRQADRLGQGRAIRQEAQRRANRVIGATLRTDYLRPYPDPVRVRTDLAERADGANDAELAGRQAGRFLMLHNSLKGLQGDYNSFDEDRWPADVVQRSRIYRLNFYDLRDRLEPTLGQGCSRIPFVGCRRRDFYQTQSRYQHDLNNAVDTAALYFPAGFQEQFVDSTGFGGSRAEYAQAQANRRADRARQEAMQGSSQLSATAWMFILLGMGGAAYGLYRLLKRKQEGDSVSGNYGTADFASPLTPKFDESVFKGVFFGPAAHPEIKGSIFAPVVSAPESHALIVAPSRTGKGTSVIAPTLLLYKSSLITIDPKGENAAITARYRRDQLGHTVHIVNPWDVHGALFKSYGLDNATFNPLDVLDPKDRNIVGIANTIAVTICHQRTVNDSFWQDNATAMLAGILLWVADTPGESKTLANVADIVSGGEHAADLRQTLFPRMVASSSYRGAMRKLVGRFVQMDDKTYSGVIAQLSKSLQFLADDQIATATDHSSFGLADLANGKTTLYIVIPDDQMQAQAIWLKLMVTAVTQTFKRYRPAAHGVRGMFLIDEFPVLGRVDSIVTDIALVGGSGLDVTLIVQGLDQLRALYGASAETIISNCGYKWFCNIKDLQTADYVSKALGQMTVRTVSETISSADGKTSKSNSYGEMGRALFFPDELMSMGNKVAFAFQPKGRPHYIKPLDYRNLASYLSHPDAPAMPNLKAYDHNPFHQRSHSGQNDGAKSDNSDGGAGGGGDSGPSSQSQGSMDRAEALAMLGLDESASADQVRESYKNLISKLHPDKGGTTRLAQLLNEARDLLLGKKK